MGWGETATGLGRFSWACLLGRVSAWDGAIRRDFSVCWKVFASGDGDECEGHSTARGPPQDETQSVGLPRGVWCAVRGAPESGVCFLFALRRLQPPALQDAGPAAVGGVDSRGGEGERFPEGFLDNRGRVAGSGKRR